MKTYKLVIRGGPAIPEFTHEFTQSSDEMACAAAERMIKVIGVGRFYAFNLFNEDGHVATFDVLTAVQRRAK